MKRIMLTESARNIVNGLCQMMMEMNNRNDHHTAQTSTYGRIHDAIVEFVRVETGINLRESNSRHGWNLGGNESYAEDIQVVLDEIIRERYLAAERALQDFMCEDDERDQDYLGYVLKDINKARRETTEEEYSEEEHHAHLNAAFFLLHGPSIPCTHDKSGAECAANYYEDSATIRREIARIADQTEGYTPVQVHILWNRYVAECYRKDDKPKISTFEKWSNLPIKSA